MGPIRTMVDYALREVDTDSNPHYASSGRDSIPPEELLRAQLPMALYTVRSERYSTEQIEYNLLLCWIFGFSVDDKVWDHSSFPANRDRLLDGELARCLVAQALGQTDQAKEHFGVDVTLIEAAGALKRYRPRDEDAPPAMPLMQSANASASSPGDALAWARPLTVCARAVLSVARRWYSSLC